MSEDAARVRAVAARFRERFGSTPEVFSAPGRVNLIGEHTDYNGGFALPMAIEERTWVAAARRSDRVIRAYSLELRKERSFSLDDPWQRRQKWLDYVEGVARALGARGVPVGGADLYFTSDVPLGAGLSSSAALELGIGLALTTLAGHPLSLEELARVGQTAENDFVGVRSGVMDQLASALGRAGHALFIDCRSLEATPVPIPDAPVTFLIADTGVKHAHAGNGYNERREECQRAALLLRASGRSLESLRDISVEALDELARLLPEPLDRRVRHVVRENARTSAAVDALRHAHFTTLGRLMNGSHASLRDDYEVSAPELDHLVAEAQRHTGVLGARLTGGGFGGSALVLVSSLEADRVQAALARSFREKFGREPTFRTARPSPGARREVLAPA